MAKPTKQQQALEALETQGYRRQSCNSTKYIKLAKGAETVWLGKAGAVRVGRTIADSFSVSDRLTSGPCPAGRQAR